MTVNVADLLEGSNRRAFKQVMHPRPGVQFYGDGGLLVLDEDGISKGEFPNRNERSTRYRRIYRSAANRTLLAVSPVLVDLLMASRDWYSEEHTSRLNRIGTCLGLCLIASIAGCLYSIAFADAGIELYATYLVVGVSSVAGLMAWVRVHEENETAVTRVDQALDTLEEEMMISYRDAEILYERACSLDATCDDEDDEDPSDRDDTE